LIPSGYKLRKDKSVAALSLLCILLISFTSIVQAVHVHTDDSKLSTHECSICSVAHSGVLISALYRPVPLSVRTQVTSPTEGTRRSFGFVSSLRIRPPPSV